MSTDGPSACTTITYIYGVKHVSSLFIIVWNDDRDRPFPEYCNLGGISTECSNVFLNPVQRKSLVVIPEVHDSFLDEAGTREKAQCAGPVVEGNIDDRSVEVLRGKR